MESEELTVSQLLCCLRNETQKREKLEKELQDHKERYEMVHCNVLSCFLSGLLLQLPSLWLMGDKLKYQYDLDGEFPECSLVIMSFCHSSDRDKPQVPFCEQKSFSVLLPPVAPQIKTNYLLPLGFQLSAGDVRTI